MAFRNFLLLTQHTLLRQHISRALKPQKTPLLLTLGLLTGGAMLPANAQDTHQDSRYEWRCSPAGDGWQCREVKANGAAYQRPTHVTRHSAASAKQSSNTDSAKRADLPRDLNAAQVDWVKAENLTEQQRREIAQGCCGRYIEPVRSDADAQLDPASAPLRADADSSELLQNSLAILKGDVRLSQGSRLLQADSAELDQANNTAKLSGQIRLREPGVLITGSEMFLDIDSGDAKVSDASFVMHEQKLRGEASELQHSTAQTLTLMDGAFTQCEPESNVWELRGSELSIDQATQQGYGKHVRLNVKGVPVFYTPYLRFPVGDQRMSGLLFPTLSSGDAGGLDLAVPYYLNLAPNYDATLTPRLKDGHGAMLEAEVRHLSEHFNSEVSLGFLGSDDGGSDDDLDQRINDGSITASEAYPHKGQDRWLASIEQSGGLDSRWYSELDMTAVSDDDYFRDLDTASLEVSSQTHLEKTAELGYRGQHWSSSVRVTEYQTITEAREPYKQRPRINVDGRYRLADNWLLELDHEYVEFDHKDDSNNTTGERVRLDYSLTWDKQWLWGFLKPSGKLKSLSYKLDEANLDASDRDSPSVTVAQGALDAGLFFERQGAGYLQTFEPHLFYFYSDYENQDELVNAEVDFDTSELTFNYNQLFRDSAFSGGDRIGDDNRLSVGLTTRFIDDTTGVERLRASIGQIFHFDDRAISINQTTAEALNDASNTDPDSELATQVAAQIGDFWRFKADLMLDPDSNDKVSRGSTSLRYHDDSDNLFNLGYRYTRKNPITVNSELVEQHIKQADISFVLPLFGNWNVIGRQNYDFTNKRELETFAGLEYNSCCYRMRIVGRQWVDSDLLNIVDDSQLDEDKGIFFEFQLIGLGGSGNAVTSILKDGIYGYDTREENLK